MKSFFEEYGFVILAAIIVILLIAMATPIGTLIRSNISHIVESFGEKTNQKLDYAMREYQTKDIITLSGAYKKGDKYEDLSLVVMENLGNDKYLVLAPTEYNKNGLTNFGCIANEGNNACASGSPNNNYATSMINEKLNGELFYDKLSDSLKEAIVEQNVVQYKYTSSPFSYETTKDNGRSDYWNDNGTWKIGDKTVWGNDQAWSSYRGQSGKYGLYKFNFNASKKVLSQTTAKVFLPSAEELNKIVNVNDSKEMEDFLCTNSNAYHMWLRDAYGSRALYALYSHRSLGDGDVWNCYISVRPAFVLDLSKVSYSAK